MAVATAADRRGIGGYLFDPSGVLDNYKHHTYGFAIPVLVFGSLATAVHAMLKRADKIAFVLSALYCRHAGRRGLRCSVVLLRAPILL